MRVKTRIVTDTEVSNRLNHGCPCCGNTLVLKVRTVRDDAGKMKYGGEFFGCSAFPKCDYWLSVGDKKNSSSERVDL
jgi:ssDNA-binding Zn-finger/Zn-ribbon topoisomerase 1